MKPILPALALAATVLSGCATTTASIKSSWRETPPTPLAAAEALTRIKQALLRELGLVVAGEDQGMFWTDGVQVSWRELGGPLDIPLPVRLVFMEDRTSPFSALYKLEMVPGSSAARVQKMNVPLGDASAGAYGRRVMLVLSDALGRAGRSGDGQLQAPAVRAAPPAAKIRPQKVKTRKSRRTKRRIRHTR